jgi:hypothetical protein
MRRDNAVVFPVETDPRIDRRPAAKNSRLQGSGRNIWLSLGVDLPGTPGITCGGRGRTLPEVGSMARKSQLSKAAHAVKNFAGTAKRQLSYPGNAAKTIAGVALGAATIAATGVVAKKVADAVSERGEQLADATSKLKRKAEATFPEPFAKRPKRAAPRKYSRGSQNEVKSEMHRYKRGKARSGRKGKGGKVKSRKQAIAIGLSKARKKGKKVPRK